LSGRRGFASASTRGSGLVGHGYRGFRRTRAASGCRPLPRPPGRLRSRGLTSLSSSLLSLRQDRRRGIRLGLGAPGRTLGMLRQPFRPLELELRFANASPTLLQSLASRRRCVLRGIGRSRCLLGPLLQLGDLHRLPLARLHRVGNPRSEATSSHRRHPGRLFGRDGRRVVLRRSWPAR